MIDKTISPLRQRMIEDMTARHFAEKVQTDYIRYVRTSRLSSVARLIPPTAEVLRLFQLHMTKAHVSPGGINATVVALRFFFKVTLERDDLVMRLTLDSPKRISPTAPRPPFDNRNPRTLDQPSSKRPTPTARDTQIPIDRANGASALPDRGFLLGRLSNVGPAATRPVVLGPASETLHRRGRRLAGLHYKILKNLRRAYHRAIRSM